MLIRHARFLLLVCSTYTIGGCGPIVIGTTCSSAGDCGDKQPLCVQGLNGSAKICTHACANNSECPLGYDCAMVDGATSKTCNKTLYATDKTTGDPLLFGKPCPSDDSVCENTGDKNAAPTCRKGVDPSETKAVALATDPAAYCTGSCTNDNDCPLPMKCDVDYDGVTKCLKRDVCDECKYDENCGYTSGLWRSDFNRCVPVTREGKTGHYCSKECNTDKDCPGAAKYSKWMVCQPATTAEGGEGNFCLHWYGACVGDGEICDPCKTVADCGTGLKCMDNPYGLYSYPVTGERMCNKTCQTDADCTGPNDIACDSVAMDSVFKCTGDTRHISPGNFACNL
jgi:hypothetical protein